MANLYYEDTVVERGRHETPFGDTFYGIKVTIGKVKSDQEILDQLREFRNTFTSSSMTIVEDGPNVSGESVISARL